MASTAITSALIHTLQIILMSTGFLFIVIRLTPPVFNFAAAQLPATWSSLRPWIRPLYLYVFVNGIIVAIAAFSRLHHRQEHSNDHSPAADGEEFRQNHRRDQNLSSATHVEVYAYANPKDIHTVPAMETEIMCDETMTFGEAETGGVYEDEEEVEKAIVVRQDVTEKAENGNFATVYGRSEESDPPPPPTVLARQGTSEIVSSFFELQIEKPPPSAKPRRHRRRTRTTPEGGKAPRVAEPKGNDTLESTWKAITEGRHVPPSSHLQKSDTWDNRAHPAASSDLSPSVKKPETFMERTNQSPAAALSKVPSPSRDELNQRSEEFINKIKEGMRLQKQKSIQQLMMINPAA